MDTMKGDVDDRVRVRVRVKYGMVFYGQARL